MISVILDDTNVVVNDGHVVVVVVDGRHVGEGGCQLEEHVCSEALSNHPLHQLFSEKSPDHRHTFQVREKPLSTPNLSQSLQPATGH